jgi:CubicO group peptidase (beta-lactamase class C family)
MKTFLCLLFIAVTCGAPPPTLITDYYGILKTSDGNARLYLHHDRDQSQLTIVSFRGYPISVRNLKTSKDSIRFKRSDAPDEYNGRISSDRKRIVGTWTTDSNQKIELSFVATDPDTIRGLNPRSKRNNALTPPSYDANDRIPVAEVSYEHMSARKLAAVNNDIIKKKYNFIHALLVARYGALVVEEYYYNFPRKGHFGIQSVTKSFVSALTGIAISKGEIAGVNSPVCNYLPAWHDLACNGQNRSIALSDVMSMATGLRWDEVSYDYGHELNSSMIAAESGDEVKYLLSQARDEKASFAYNSVNHIIMNHVLRQSTGMTNGIEMKTRLLDPLGITVYDLGESKDGILGDIFLRPRDMLKFGMTFQSNGVWEGKQVVPESWVKESTTTKVMAKPDLGYGYFWWTKSFDWKGKHVQSFFAWGYGGQYIFVVPELDLVVALAGTNWSTDPEGKYVELFQQIVNACE